MPVRIGVVRRFGLLLVYLHRIARPDVLRVREGIIAAVPDVPCAHASHRARDADGLRVLRIRCARSVGVSAVVRGVASYTGPVVARQRDCLVAIVPVRIGVVRRCRFLLVDPDLIASPDVLRVHEGVVAAVPDVSCARASHRARDADGLRVRCIGRARPARIGAVVRGVTSRTNPVAASQRDGLVAYVPVRVRGVRRCRFLLVDLHRIARSDCLHIRKGVVAAIPDVSGADAPRGARDADRLRVRCVGRARPARIGAVVRGVASRAGPVVASQSDCLIASVPVCIGVVRRCRFLLVDLDLIACPDVLRVLECVVAAVSDVSGAHAPHRARDADRLRVCCVRRARPARIGAVVRGVASRTDPVAASQREGLVASMPVRIGVVRRCRFLFVYLHRIACPDVLRIAGRIVAAVPDISGADAPRGARDADRLRVRCVGRARPARIGAVVRGVTSRAGPVIARQRDGLVASVPVRIRTVRRCRFLLVDPESHARLE